MSRESGFKPTVSRGSRDHQAVLVCDAAWRLGVEERDLIVYAHADYLMNTLTNAMPPTLLRGWAEIAAFTRKSPCAMPAVRVCLLRDGEDTSTPTSGRSARGSFGVSSDAESGSAQRTSPRSGACGPLRLQDR
jgi:hypothetical protein